MCSIEEESLKKMPVKGLLALSDGIHRELRERKVLRSGNKITGDLAEHLFCKAYGWAQAENSKKGYDAIGKIEETDKENVKIQIKSRKVEISAQKLETLEQRVEKLKKSIQFSFIRNFEGNEFNKLACVIFGENYEILLAGIIDYSILKKAAGKQIEGISFSYQEHVKARILRIHFPTFQEKNKDAFKDVTTKIKTCFEEKS